MTYKLFIFVFIGIHLVPIDITVSNYGSTNEVNLDASGSSIEIPPTPSSCFSDNSSYLETNLDHSSSTLDTKTNDDPSKRSVSPQHKQRFKDRKLVRQKKCDYESPPIPATSDDKVHAGSALGVSTPNPITPVPKKVFQSQPSLNIPLEEWKDLLYQEQEQEANPSVKPHHPLKRLCSIQRSQSSGAERVRVREKFLRRRRQLHSNPSLSYTRNRHASQSLSKEDILNLYRNSTCDSGSCDIDSWTADEKACDEEVRRITGTDLDTDHEYADDSIDLSTHSGPSPYNLVDQSNLINQKNNSNNQEFAPVNPTETVLVDKPNNEVSIVHKFRPRLKSTHGTLETETDSSLDVSENCAVPCLILNSDKSKLSSSCDTEQNSRGDNSKCDKCGDSNMASEVKPSTENIAKISVINLEDPLQPRQRQSACENLTEEDTDV